MKTQDAEMIEKLNAACAAQARTAEAQGQCVREKYWSELSIEEKIERTREQVKHVARQHEHMQLEFHQFYRQMHMVAAQLQQHRHMIDNAGEVVLPIGSANAPTDAGQCLGDKQLPVPVDPDKVYF